MNKEHELQYFRMILGIVLFSIAVSVVQTENVTRREAGVYFRLNQKAVDYIGDLASDAMPQLLERMQLPTVKAGPATISQITIEKFARPTIRAKFVDSLGVSSMVLLPEIRVSAKASVSFFFVSIDEKFIIEFVDLKIRMDVHFGRNETINRNIIDIPTCNVTTAEIRLVLAKNSELKSFEDTIKEQALSAIKTQVCETTLDAIKYVDDQEIPMGHVNVTVSPPTADTKVNETESSIAAELGSSLCAADRLDGGPFPETDDSQNETEEVTSSAPSSSENSLPGDWNVDLNLNYPPKFSDEDVVFGIDGGILLNGQTANDIVMPHTLNTSVLNERMVGIMISEYIPNTLLSHVFEGGLGQFQQKFYADNLPGPLKGLAKLFCGKCYLEVHAELTDKPKVEIHKELGARLAIAGNVTVLFQGRKTLYDVLRADTTLHLTMKMNVRHSKVYGDVSLSSVDVNVKKIGLSGALAAPLEKVVGFIIPRALWPQVKKRLRFALNKRGVKLPVICGVEFDHMSLDYVDHAAVLNTDFTFDLPRFIRKFKAYLAHKAHTMKRAVIPQYL